MTCKYDDTQGIYDWQCMRCRARWYVTQPERMRPAIDSVWRETMPVAEQAEVRRIVDEWTAKPAA